MKAVEAIDIFAYLRNIDSLSQTLSRDHRVWRLTESVRANSKELRISEQRRYLSHRMTLVGRDSCLSIVHVVTSLTLTFWCHYDQKVQSLSIAGQLLRPYDYAEY